MRDYLRARGVAKALVLFTGCAGEPGVPFALGSRGSSPTGPSCGSRSCSGPSTSRATAARSCLEVPQVVSGDLYLEALTSPGANWGGWEVHHARPADDPQHYREVEGVLLSHAFNRLYTVASPKTMEAFRAPAGLAMVRHYTLNENMMFDKSDKEKLGYFVADIERAGPYCMQAEAVAMANGDPTMIGYLVGDNFGRGFPEYVRDFNANFLALPALPSTVVARAASDPEVVVRRIDTEKHGSWIAVINPSLQAKPAVTVTLPAGQVSDAVSGQPVAAGNGSAWTAALPTAVLPRAVTGTFGIASK